MPFKKIAGCVRKDGRCYRSPSGRRFTRKQVKRYYATKGKWK